MQRAAAPEQFGAIRSIERLKHSWKIHTTGKEYQQLGSLSISHKKVVGFNTAIRCCAYTNGLIILGFFDNRVEVRDTGCSMSQLKLEQVCDFLGGRQVAPWTSLGFAIVRRICSRFHWGIEIESKEAIGTTVRILFHSDISGKEAQW